MAWVGPQVGWSGISGNHQGVVNGISQVDEDSDIWYPSVSSVLGVLSKGTMTSASTYVWKKAVSLSLALMPDNSVPPLMSLAPFKLLLQSWSSEQVSLSKSVCSPFKRNVWYSRSPLFHLATILVFTARSYGGFSSKHWNSSLGKMV